MRWQRWRNYKASSFRTFVPTHSFSHEISILNYVRANLKR